MPPKQTLREFQIHKTFCSGEQSGAHFGRVFKTNRHGNELTYRSLVAFLIQLAHCPIIETGLVHKYNAQIFQTLQDSARSKERMFLF